MKRRACEGFLRPFPFVQGDKIEFRVTEGIKKGKEAIDEIYEEVDEEGAPGGGWFYLN